MVVNLNKIRMPTLEQRKAVFRTIFDIAIHNKRELSNNHKYCLIRWGQSFLHLSIIECAHNFGAITIFSKNE